MRFRSSAFFERLVAIRRELHQNAELAFSEIETARIIMRELDRLGIPYRYTGQGGCIVARLERGHGPCIALRADMDALPGEEKTGLPFASKNPHAVHACGHDGHMAMVLGAAMLLKEDPPAADVRFVFQPAEEKGGGARTVLASGELEGVDAIFAGHVTHHYTTGEIMVASGVITAQSDRFTLRIQGKGGHGARPHEAVDAVVIAGLMITAIQTLVSRETNPVHPSVVTIGEVHAGSAPNVIAEEAILKGSIRTTSSEARQRIHQGLKRMAKSMGDLHCAKITVEIEEGYPPVVNRRKEAEIARRAAAAVVGEEGVVEMEHPSMGSEDFSYYLEKIPGCYVRFGARKPEWPYIPLHSPSFTFDEEVLMVGADFFAAVAHEASNAY